MFSASPLRADIAQCSQHVGFVPITVTSVRLRALNYKTKRSAFHWNGKLWERASQIVTKTFLSIRRATPSQVVMYWPLVHIASGEGAIRRRDDGHSAGRGSGRGSARAKHHGLGM